MRLLVQDDALQRVCFYELAETDAPPRVARRWRAESESAVLALGDQAWPCVVDWDGDGLPDLMPPNETNRIVWYRNVGTRQEPRFGPRQFLAVDGFILHSAPRAGACREFLVPASALLSAP